MSNHCLTPAAASYLNAPKKERIDFVNEVKWIDYPAAAAILADLEGLMNFPQRSRMPCRLIVGNSNNGKTELLKHFAAKHPPDPNLDGDAVRIPVLSIVASKADVKALFKSILVKLFEQMPRNATPTDLQDQAVLVLNRVRPKLILIDEANELVQGTRLRTAECLSALKYITNATGIPIVAAGTREALNGFGTEEQIENRFEPIFLPVWKLDKEFRTLLASLETTLPLPVPSKLSSQDLARQVHGMTGGKIGEVCSLLSCAAVYAIDRDLECITSEALTNSKYRPISARRQAPR